jgi:hypothetical protein
MYYTLIGPTLSNPDGCNNYTSATSSILSAVSLDCGQTWNKEAGVRLAPHKRGAELRVVSPEVVPLDKLGRHYRMYYEGVAAAGDAARDAAGVRSAVSHDGGLTFVPEAGWRVASSAAGGSINSPRVVPLRDGRYRLYASRNGPAGDGIVSAVSVDGGLTFTMEEGIRLAKETAWEAHSLFAPEPLVIGGDGLTVRMFYAGIPHRDSAVILSALSADGGLTFVKDSRPVLLPGGTRWDMVKCSEMCVMYIPASLADDGIATYRMFYEGCDGTSEDLRGVWRILAATAVAGASASPKL